jgi:Family of unknown function (DUF6962)
MTQTPVALSDFALALEAALFAGLINPGRRVQRRGSAQARSPNPTLTSWFEFFFYAVAVASLLGGAVHGYVLQPTTASERALWPATMIAVGAAALSAWGIAFSLQLSPRNARRAAWIATVEFIIYTAVIICGTRSFRVAILNYLPAVLFLLLVFVSAYVRQRNSAYLVGAIATVITLVAAALQQSQFDVVTLGLTHNLLYHLLKGVGLLLLFLCARQLTGSNPDRPSSMPSI